MKKIVAILFVLALALPAMADTVSLTKATDAASAFFNAGSQTRAGRVTPQLVWMGAEVTRSPYSAPFYVFNNPQGGWIMIAGEDSGHAILGWSDEGRFDPSDLPANAAAWFEEYANQITWARTHFLPQSEASAREWSDLLEGRLRQTPTPVKVLQTAKWGQSNPYNMLCPTIRGNHAVTGCVATAMAITMRYHQHPTKGTGTIGGYTLKTKIGPDSTLTAPTVVLDEDSGYDWSNMPLEAPGSWNDTQKEAVAKLIYHCGLAAEMDYDLTGSSAATTKAYRSLVQRMGYDASAIMVNRESNSIGAWTKMIIDEFRADRVVIIDGYNPVTPKVGHCFVGDGYDSEDRIHINWGWSGSSSDGFFETTYFKPGTAGDLSKGDYRINQNAILGLQPRGSNVSELQFRICDEFIMTSEIDYSASDYPFGVSFGVANDGIYSSKCVMSVYLCKYNNTKRYSCKAVDFGGLAVGKYYAASTINKYYTACKMTTLSNNGLKPGLGDKLMVAYQDSSSTYKIITRKTDFSLNNNIPVYDTPFISVKDGGTYSIGDCFDFEIVNSRTAPADMTVDWSFDGAPIELDEVLGQASVRLTEAGDHIVKAVVTIGGETQTLIQEIHVE